MKDNKLNECYRIANNALYLADNSDYATALWEILDIIKPDLFDEEHELEYIQEEKKNRTKVAE